MAKIPESYNLGNREDLTVTDLLVIIQDVYSDLAIAVNKKPDLYQRTTDGLTTDTFLANGDLNVNSSTKKVQMLTEHASASTVLWTELTPGTPGDLNSLTADDGTVVVPSSGNIDVSGNSTQGVTTSGSGSTLTITVADATTTRKGVSELATDGESISGSLTDNHVINPSSLKAKLGTQTLHGIGLGSGTTAALTWTAEPSNGQLLIGSTGNFPVLGSLTQPAAGLTITGGAGSITFALADDLLALENLATTGVASRTGASTWATSSITQNSLVYGNATQGLTNLGVLTNGQLAIGSTGSAPVAATLASAGSTIAITNGAGTINLETGVTVPTSFVTDSGTATPALGVLNVIGTTAQGITSSGAGSTITFTNADATDTQKGVTELGTDAEVIDGTLTDYHVVNPSSLKAKLGVQTDHGLLVGSGTTAAITALGVASNGQLPIGSAGADPVLGNITSARDLEITNGAGTISIDLNQNTHDTVVNGWHGSVIEDDAVTVASDGSTITLSIQKTGGGNLTVIFSDGFYAWTTAPATVTLTAGTDTVPVLNYVFLLQSTKTLTANITGFPTTEHAPVATVLCQSAATLQTKFAMKDHMWTDHTEGSNNQGHISHLNSWIRGQNATWKSGVVQNYTITPQGGAVDNVTIQTTSGMVLQLHDHAFPAFSNPIDYYVVNFFGTPYTIVTDLSSLLTDSANVSMSNRYFTLVLWGVVSESSNECKMFINLPSGSYNSSAGVTADTSKFANFTIPAEFKGTGFLISQWNLKHSPAASGTWTSVDEVDLRGLFPGISAGSGTAAATQFPDSTFRVFNNTDSTKLMAFEVGGLTIATTRTLTVQDADGTIALSGVANFGTGAQTFTDGGLLVGSGTSPITALAAMTNGQLPIGSTGVDPVPATLTAGTNVTITNAAGSITINSTASGSGLTWSAVTVNASFTVNTGTVANKAGLLTMTLPATAAIGDRIRITGINTAVGWRIAQNANQQIHYNIQSTTVGVGGYLEATNIRDSIEIVCVVAGASTEWNVLSDEGNITWV